MHAPRSPSKVPKTSSGRERRDLLAQRAKNLMRLSSRAVCLGPGCLITYYLLTYFQSSKHRRWMDGPRQTTLPPHRPAPADRPTRSCQIQYQISPVPPPTRAHDFRTRSPRDHPRAPRNGRPSGKLCNCSNGRHVALVLAIRRSLSVAVTSLVLGFCSEKFQ